MADYLQTVDVKNTQSQSSVLFQNYACTPSFQKSWKIGGKIVGEFQADLDGSETTQLSIKLGNVMKHEVPWQKLYDAVNSKTVKINHPLVEAVKSCKKRSLFLIGKIVNTLEIASSLEEDTEIDGDLGGGPQVTLTLHSDGSSETKQQHTQYTIPAGTTLVYSCYELKIGDDGALSLHLGDH